LANSCRRKGVSLVARGTVPIRYIDGFTERIILYAFVDIIEIVPIIALGALRVVKAHAITVNRNEGGTDLATTARDGISGIAGEAITVGKVISLAKRTYL
jgi:hypothetical protein